jgi:hypothetical protein
MPLVLGSDLSRYVIRTFAGKVLDVANIAVEDRAIVQQWGQTGGANQEFYVDLCGRDVYRIIARHSGRVLDLSGPSGEGSPIWQFAWAAVDNQRWTINEQKDGTIEVQSAWDRSLVLDVGGASQDDGAPLIAWTRNNQANQRFRLVKV